MTDREKLIALMDAARDFADGECDKMVGCSCCPNDILAQHCQNPAIADHLLANGVVVREWIPVTERLPQQDEPTGALCETVQVLLSDGTVTVGWCNRSVKRWYYLPFDATRFTENVFGETPVVAWQPLSAPPTADMRKGENGGCETL